MNWLKRHEWWIVGALACLAFALGYAGMASYYSTVGISSSPLDIVYGVLHLYRVSYPIDGVSGGALSAPNLMVQIARFLAPATVAYSLLRLVAAAIGDAASKLAVAGYEDHVVVCGAGERGFMIATSLLSLGRRVLVVDPFLNGSHLTELRAAGAKIVIGSALDATVLKRARVVAARHVAVVTGDEGRNFAVARKCAQLAAQFDRAHHQMRPLTIRAHASREFMDVFEEVKPFGLVDSNADARFFESGDMAARQIAINLSIKHGMEIVVGHAKPKLLIVGDGSFTAALLGMILRQMQLPGCAMPVIDVVSTNLDPVLESFPQAHPQLDHVGAVQFSQKSRGQLLSEEFLLRKSQTGGGYDVVIVSLEDAFACIKLGRRLTQQMRAEETHTQSVSTEPSVVLCVKPTADLNGVEGHLAAERYGQIYNVTRLGCCSEAVFDEALDAQAKAAHESYLEHFGEAAHDPARPSGAPWAILKEEFKAANRRTIDHDALKKVFLGQAPSREMIEKLAEAEHRSWMADRILAGWRRGEQRDDSKKLHPSIVSYHELPQSERAKDLEKVQRLCKAEPPAG